MASWPVKVVNKERIADPPLRWQGGAVGGVDCFEMSFWRTRVMLVQDTLGSTFNFRTYFAAFEL